MLERDVLALRWHPDRAGPGATATFQRLSVAYEVLSDPIARAAYDRRRRLDESSAGGAPSAPARRSAPGLMISRLSGPLNSLLACGVVRVADDDIIELVVNDAEANTGGMVTISMRVPIRCPRCSRDPTQVCARCGGAGVLEDLFSAWLAVPPDVADGTMLTPSAELPGMIRPEIFRVRRRSAR